MQKHGYEGSLDLLAQNQKLENLASGTNLRDCQLLQDHCYVKLELIHFQYELKMNLENSVVTAEFAVTAVAVVAAEGAVNFLTWLERYWKCCFAG